LRGINVGGVVIKMDRLREFWCELGFKNVRTHIQSGNVIFQAAGLPSGWLSKIEKKLLDEMGRPVAVIVRTPPELKNALDQNPFRTRIDIDPSRIAVAFLSGTASRISRQN